MDTPTYPRTPHSNPSHASESRANPAITPKAATRIPEATTNAQSAACVPASQESNATQESSASVPSVESGAALHPHSSRSSIVSSQYTSNTDLTSPSSSVESVPAYDVQPETRKSHYVRARTPERAVPNAGAGDDGVLFSPMSITSPAAVNGAKRTASGHVKTGSSLPNTPLAYAFPGHRSRQHSISSTSSSRAGEVAANLVTALEYAMLKIQNGWEHKRLPEVEQLAANQRSPNRFNTSAWDGRRNLANLIGENVDRGSRGRESHEQTLSPPSKRRSAYYAPYPETFHHTAPGPGRVPQLQPAVDIRPTPSYRQVHPAPNRNFNHAMSPPRTPMNDPPRRPPTIRTETQTAEDERDAAHVLTQLASPRGPPFSHSYASSLVASNQTSPLRSEFPTPRHVDFAHIGNSDGGGGEVRGAEGERHFGPSQTR